MDQLERKKRVLQINNVAVGGLLAISIVILPSLISLNSLDTSALVALISLSLSIPLLAAFVVVNLFEISIDPTVAGKEPIWMMILSLGGIFAAIIGITAAIWHSSWIGGVVFGAITVVAFALYYPFISKHFYRTPRHMMLERGAHSNWAKNFIRTWQK